MTEQTHVFHFTLGPVQGFVSQARRTRDLWAGSFLLSFLSGHAMKAIIDAGGTIVFPKVSDTVNGKDTITDPLLAAICKKPLASDASPKIGSLPNRFKATVPADFKGNLCNQAVQEAWEKVAGAVWNTYLKDVTTNKQKHDIWEQQVTNFWDISWVLGADPGDGSDNSWLDRRKNWRTYSPPAQAGDKCTLMGSWQELSGLVRTTDSKKQDAFWQRVRHQECVKTLDLSDNERLCPIALIKRFFPYVAKDAIGWKLDVTAWPSTSYFAAVPWLVDVQEAPHKPQLPENEHVDVAKLRDDYVALVHANLDRGFYGEMSTSLSGLDPHPFNKLDGQLYFQHSLESDKERQYTNGDASKVALQNHLGDMNKAIGHPPSAFYALLFMDGDGLGKLLQSGVLEPSRISEALAAFTADVDPIVISFGGKTVYAGGDDVLALVPLNQVLSAATALRERYVQAFQQEFSTPADQAKTLPKMTISAGIVFAHFSTSLRAVMEEAHHLLDDVAKDGNGRDSIAASVLTGSGRTVLWVSSWTDTTTSQTIPEVLQDLGTAFEEEFASKFFYNVRQRFEVLTDDEHSRQKNGYRLIAGLKPFELLVAEYKKSRERDVVHEEVEERVGKLVRVCRVRKGDTGQEQTNTLNIAGAMLVRFLATKGRGVER